MQLAGAHADDLRASPGDDDAESLQHREHWGWEAPICGELVSFGTVLDGQNRRCRDEVRDDVGPGGMRRCPPAELGGLGQTGGAGAGRARLCADAIASTPTA